MRRLALLLILLFFSSCTHPLMQGAASKSEKRVALVVANQNYPTKALDNPFNDAKAIIKTLRGLDFEVIYAHDTSYQGFDQALKRFQAKIDENTTAFFYFSGHANTLQTNSSELFFLMVEHQEDVLVSIHKLYETLRKSKAKNSIVCIDACRNNTYAKAATRGMKYRGVGFHGVKQRGRFEDEPLAQKRKLIIKDNYSYKRPQSIIISYATHLNEQAHDAGKTNPHLSPYANYLSQHLKDERGSILEIFRRIRIKMEREFDGTQSNMEESYLLDNIYLQLPRAIGSPTIPG